jgi:hypothetical protein
MGWMLPTFKGQFFDSVFFFAGGERAGTFYIAKKAYSVHNSSVHKLKIKNVFSPSVSQRPGLNIRAVLQ